MVKFFFFKISCLFSCIILKWKKTVVAFFRQNEQNRVCARRLCYYSTTAAFACSGLKRPLKVAENGGRYRMYTTTFSAYAALCNMSAISRNYYHRFFLVLFPWTFFFMWAILMYSLQRNRHLFFYIYCTTCTDIYNFFNWNAEYRGCWHFIYVKQQRIRNPHTKKVWHFHQTPLLFLSDHLMLNLAQIFTVSPLKLLKE